MRTAVLPVLQCGVERMLRKQLQLVDDEVMYLKIEIGSLGTLNLLIKYVKYGLFAPLIKPLVP